MLITCPECGLQVSDSAEACPHCGYPIKSKKRRKRRMRLPNSFGQISKLKQPGLRKPYRAMISVGKNENGRPIVKLLKPQAYFETYTEAYQALLEYNSNPYDLDNDITMKELYDKWLPKYQEKVVPSAIRGVTSAWNHCQVLHSMRVKDVRVRHIKGCIDDCEKQSIKKCMKSMLNIMLGYALELEIVDKNYARAFSAEISNEPASEHIAFTDDELNIMWKHSDDQMVSAILIQCYTGLRPQELCKIKVENINNGVIIGGMKTEAGKNRIIPIHSKISQLIDRKLLNRDLKSDYLLGGLTYDQYRHRFDKAMEDLGLDTNHRPHDPRKTFVTLAKRAEVDEYAIKKIVGHAISDLTERVYTERSTEWLKQEIEKI